jgi:transcriptional regulator with XRE-family HTH domain
LGLTQKELNARTRTLGFEFGQNNVSRLESGVSQRVNDVDRLTALGKALEFENSPAFILIAFGPPELALTPEVAIIEAMSGWPEDKKWDAVRVIKAPPDPPESS